MSREIIPAEFCERSFDYIIVGGGTAGLVVAARLSENPKIRVGVIEAGNTAFDEPMINVPGRFGESLGSKYDWQFETTPQAGIGGRKLPFPRGKVLGGTSALNFMTWNRGCREDYDGWEALGNEGWGWDDLLPFFKKSESFFDPGPDHQKQHSSYFHLESHGIEGPIKTVYSKEYGESHPHWHSTLHKLGVETNRSHFSGSNVGAWTSLTSVDPASRKRSYSAVEYYLPNASRPNLVVLTRAIAREIILENEGKIWRAIGVKFAAGGDEFRAKASQEVIVCAGSVQSPQLLELSGIGISEILKAANIKTKVTNLNVGENFQEHMMTAMIFEINPSIPTPEDLRSDSRLAREAEEIYNTSQSGILTCIPSSVCYLPLPHFIPTATISSLASRVPSSTPRDEILAKQFTTPTPLGQIEYNFDTSNYSPYFKSESGKKYATMLQMLQYPFSKGSIHIPPSSGTTPVTSDDKPVIDPQYYAGDGGKVDFEIMVGAQKFGAKICSTKPLSSIIVKRVFPPVSENANEDEILENFVRNYTITDWHPVGTCAMGGKLGSQAGVVDERLRVYGVNSLRVVDASIMPLQISAHLQATVYAIGEKGASMIAEDYEKAVQKEF